MAANSRGAAKGSAARGIALYVAYFGAGWLAQQSIVAPNYAIAIWPSAGIALAGLLVFGIRYWPAIFLAAFALKLDMNLDPSRLPQTLLSLFACFGLASGAALEAVAGAWLIRRFSRFPHQLDRYQDLCVMVALGGPVACVISALAGPTSLAIQGALPWSGYFANVALWWLGDTVGVALILPPVSAWASELRDLPIRTRILVTVPPAVLIVLTFATYAVLNASETNRIRETLASRSVSMRIALEQHLRHQEHLIEHAAAFIERQANLTREEFQSFAQDMLDHSADVSALEWVPRLSHGERAAFEASIRAEGYPGFELTACLPDGALVSSPERTRYFPVQYVAPLEGNEALLGLDLASEAVRRVALERAAKANRVAVSEPIMLVRTEVGRAGVLLFMPVRATESEALAQNDADTVRGFAVGVYCVRDLVNEALRPFNLADITVHLADVEGTGEKQLLVTGGGALPKSSQVLNPQPSRADMRWEADLAVADRTWRMSIAPTLDYVSGLRTHQPETVLLCGLLVTAMLGIILLVLAGRHAVTERLVAERTAQLQSEVEERARVQEQREALIQDLESALSEIKTLQGLLPICSSCKKIRDKSGQWTQIETYISAHAAVDFSHGICPECAQQLYPEFASGRERSP